VTGIHTAAERQVRRSRPRLVSANGVELCVQTFGEAGEPAILLIAGAASSMDWWEDEFCELLASGPRFVIRYDLRDTGQSVSYEPGAPGYNGSDLVADAVALLDALGIVRAHVVGISMGGGIGQHLALEHTGRVATLTLIATSPAVPRGPGKPELPPMSAELASRFAEPAPEPDWSDREAVIGYIVEGLRPFDGSLPVDEGRRRALVERVVDRTVNIASSMTNHWILDSGRPAQGRLGDMRVPTLVLHGTEDLLFPYGHAEALADEIPGARLLPLEGVGHEVPPTPLWGRVVAAILEHTDRGNEEWKSVRRA
jgi:pimeloyl-ACP methyl ester carboxylesterase